MRALSPSLNLYYMSFLNTQGYNIVQVLCILRDVLLLVFIVYDHTVYGSVLYI